MKILLLGPARPDFEAYLASLDDEVMRIDDKVTAKSRRLDGVDWIVSFGYRHIIREDLIERFPNQIVNLHISMLPWNRGADPNLWSFIEDTPKGVTVHYIDAGIDTGDIIAQEEVEMLPDDTLKSSYDRLIERIQDLFKRIWPDLREGKLKGRLQPAGGSVHRTRDRERIEHLLSRGWDTPVSELLPTAAGKREDQN